MFMVITSAPSLKRASALTDAPSRTPRIPSNLKGSTLGCGPSMRSNRYSVFAHPTVDTRTSKSGRRLISTSIRGVPDQRSDRRRKTSYLEKKMMCCQGRNSSDRWNFKPRGSSSERTSRTDILCSGWIGTLGSSLRNSTRTTRPSGFSAS